MIKKLEDLNKFDQDDDDKFDEFFEVLQQVKLDGDLESEKLLTSFKILRDVATRVYEENKLSIEYFQKEVEESSKRGNFFYHKYNYS